MRSQLLIFLLILAIPAVAAGQDSTVTDTNSVFFEGTLYSYVLKPPDGMKTIVEASMREGYSAAFVPEGQSIDSNEVLIGINFFRLTDDAPDDFLRRLIADDTAAMREFFGDDLEIYPVDSLYTSTGDILNGFFLNDPERFIANVMQAYWDGGSEILTFELVIADVYPRFQAEELFVDAINNFRPLRKGSLGNLTE